MLERLVVLGSLALGIFWVSSGCSSAGPEKSTGTNWLDCNSDADCRSVAGAQCGDEGVCVDRDGNKIAGAQTTQTGATLVAVDCYSPGQNLDRAYEPGAVGCECIADAPDTCIRGVALTCMDGRWQSVEDGACGMCWEPSEPDLANAFPDNGCYCANEEMDVCAYSQFTGYVHAACVGVWTTGGSTAPCATCDSDLQCAVGYRCEAGTCQATDIPCSVNGVLYPDLTDGIPDPTSCATCLCANGGYLGCTTIACLEEEECPSGTTPAVVCGGCGPSGECSHRITGCVPSCETDADCAEGMVCEETPEWPLGAVTGKNTRACAYSCP